MAEILTKENETPAGKIPITTENGIEWVDPSAGSCQVPSHEVSYDHSSFVDSTDISDAITDHISVTPHGGGVSSGDVDAAIAAHCGASDPHPDYLKASELPAIPVIKAGIQALTAGGSANVVFATPFANIPKVVVTSQFNTADTSTTLCAHTVTINGFTLRGAGNAAGNVAWIAIDATN